MSEIDKSTGDVVDTHKKTKDKMVESIELLNISSKVMVVAVVLILISLHRRESCPRYLRSMYIRQHSHIEPEQILIHIQPIIVINHHNIIYTH
jgi:hypothetical protein